MITHLLYLTLQCTLQLIWMNGRNHTKSIQSNDAIIKKCVPAFHILTILVWFMDMAAVFISLSCKSTIIHLQETCRNEYKYSSHLVTSGTICTWS